MTSSRVFRLALAVALVASAFAVSRGCGTPQEQASTTPRYGGRLVASFRTEPTHFNRLVEARPVARLNALLAHATLLRVHPNTGEFEPRLATEWTGSPDGLTWTFVLRSDVRFSDGVPFTAADVLFTFRALYDDRVGSPLGAELKVNGKPLDVRFIDDHHLTITFPEPFGPGLSILDSLPILPEHKLQAHLDAGTFREVWTAATPPAEMAGLGPFMLAEYVPAQHMRFVRNPHFWRADDQGQKLPYLDELDVPIVLEQNAELLRFQAGESDLTNGGARPEDIAMLRDAETAGRIRLVNAGPAIDVSTLWFNLKPGAKAVADKPWLGDATFRRALSHAVNRQAIVDTVHLGAATVVYGPVTPGHGDWYVPDLGAVSFDRSRARALLTSIGLEDRDGDGVREDTAGRPVRFSLLTQRGHTERERTSEVVTEQLRQVGIDVNVVRLDQNAIQERYMAGDFETIYYGAGASSKDPNSAFWLSSGLFHYWNRSQAEAGTEWEREIDRLFGEQSATSDAGVRRRLFAEAQQLLADHVPALWFAAAHVTVPMSIRVGGATPSVMLPVVLWNAEQLYVAGEGR